MILVVGLGVEVLVACEEVRLDGLVVPSGLELHDKIRLTFLGEFSTHNGTWAAPNSGPAMGSTPSSV